MKKIELTHSGKKYVVACEDEWGVEVFHWNARRLKFVVSISIDGAKAKDFSYYDSVANYPNPIDEDGLLNAFQCIVSDASAGMCDSIEEFMREFGYEDRLETAKIYTACVKMLNFFKAHGVDVFELQEFLSEF